MTMFWNETPNRKEKRQRIEENDLRSYMKSHGYSGEEIEACIRQSHLSDKIAYYKELLCENDEILDFLLEDGWGRAEVENALKEYNTTSQ